MKLLKLVGLVLSLALVATAFLAVGSASAEPTKLCKVNEEKCAKANTYSLKTPETFKGILANSSDFSTLVLLGLTNVKCTSGKLTLSLAETAGPLAGEVYLWNSFSCTGEGCSITASPEFETGFAAGIEATSKGNGTLTVTKNPTLVAKCSTFTCTYTASSMKFPIQGGTKSPAITSESVMTKVAAKSGAVCPNAAVYQSHFTIIEPGLSVFITH